MSAIITTKFRYKNANSLILDLLGNGSNTYYLGIGRTQQWESEVSPPVPGDTPASERDAQSNIVALKKLADDGTTRAIPRYNWISGFSYSEYDDIDSQLSTRQYYVVTDELNVYKCIKAGPSGSITKPSGFSTSVGDVLGDGYQWKYMYTISGSNVSKFLTSTFIPVKTLTVDDTTPQWGVQQAAVPGAIHRIKVVNGGSNYTTKPTVTITGNGSGCTVEASDITLTAGAVSEILVTTEGTGYSIATVTISGGDGNGATARAVISPEGGHGANPEDELGAYFIMIDTQLVGPDGSGDFITDNDFRQIILVANPREVNTNRENLIGNWTTGTAYALGDVVRYGNSLYVCDFAHTSTVFVDELNASPTYWLPSELSSASTLSALTEINYTLTSGTVLKDTLITGQTSGAMAWADSVNTSTTTIRFHQNKITGFGFFEEGESITVGTALASIDSITSPEYDLMSGEVVYIENLSPVNRNISQTEDVKLVLEL